MPTTQEWLTENSNRRFPFSSNTAGSPSPIPSGFIADLRFFKSSTEEVQVYLSRVSYDPSSDRFTLYFTSQATGDLLLSGTLTRLNNGVSRHFKKTLLASGVTICIFSPGDLWEDPSWGYTNPAIPQSWNFTYAFTQSEIEPTEVFDSIFGFRRIFILKDGPEYVIPPESVWPVNSTQKIHAGYNINIQNGDTSIGGLEVSTFLEDIITMSVEPGAGEGYPPTQNPSVIDYVGTLNGVAGDSKGNFKIELADCLRIFQPVDAGNAPIPNTLILNSDCLPCCDCSDYTAVSAAISRRSAKIKDENNMLNAMVQSVSSVYNSALESIRKKKPPIIVVRNVRSIEDSITFSVQNISSVPAYAYVGIVKGTGLPSDLAVKSGQSFLSVLMSTSGNFCPIISANKSTLAPLAYTKYENPSASMPPEFQCAADIGILVGNVSTTSGITPIPPGGRVDVILYSASIRSSIDAYIAANGGAGFVPASGFKTMTLGYTSPSISFNSIGIYGSSLSYPCMPDSFSVTFNATQAPAPTGCGTGASYVGIQK